MRSIYEAEASAESLIKVLQTALAPQLLSPSKAAQTLRLLRRTMSLPTWYRVLLIRDMSDRPFSESELSELRHLIAISCPCIISELASGILACIVFSDSSAFEAFDLHIILRNIEKRHHYYHLISAPTCNDEGMSAILREMYLSICSYQECLSSEALHDKIEGAFLRYAQARKESKCIEMLSALMSHMFSSNAYNLHQLRCYFTHLMIHFDCSFYFGMKTESESSRTLMSIPNLFSLDRENMEGVILQYVMRAFESVQTTNSGIGIVRKVIAYMEDNYAEPLRIGDISKRVHINADYLGRLFRATTGYSFTAYLTRLRMHHACELLESGDLSIKQISMSIGYQDSAYFTKLFSRQFHCTPSEFRRKMVPKEK